MHAAITDADGIACLRRQKVWWLGRLDLGGAECRLNRWRVSNDASDDDRAWSGSGSFDSGARADGRPDYANGTSEPSGGGSAADTGGLFGSLIGFFSASGGLVLLFGLLILLMIVGIGAAVLTWLRTRGGRTAGWAERASRITFRP